jgi:hypothetical protein
MIGEHGAPSCRFGLKFAGESALQHTIFIPDNVF